MSSYNEDEEQASAHTSKTKAEWLEAAKRLCTKKQLKDNAAVAKLISDDEDDSDNIDPSDSAS
jgi:hypothetical protein